jgi:hypothetical protein
VSKDIAQTPNPLWQRELLENLAYDEKQYNGWYRRLWRKLHPKRFKRVYGVDVVDSIVYATAVDIDKKTGMHTVVSSGVVS